LKKVKKFDNLLFVRAGNMASALCFCERIIMSSVKFYVPSVASFILGLGMMALAVKFGCVAHQAPEIEDGGPTIASFVLGLLGIGGLAGSVALWSIAVDAEAEYRTSLAALGFCQNCGYPVEKTSPRCPECGAVNRRAMPIAPETKPVEAVL
jgi:hypothetical protein